MTKRPHINIHGEFQSDKYPTCPAGKVPLSVNDPSAQSLLWEYAQRRRTVDAEFADDLEFALTNANYPSPQPTDIVETRKGMSEFDTATKAWLWHKLDHALHELERRRREVNFLRYYEIPDDAVAIITRYLKECTDGLVGFGTHDLESVVDDTIMNIDILRRQRDEAQAHASELQKKIDEHSCTQLRDEVRTALAEICQRITNVTVTAGLSRDVWAEICKIDSDLRRHVK